MFEKAASGYNLMPGSIDEEHTEMIWIVPTVHTMALDIWCFLAGHGFEIHYQTHCVIMLTTDNFLHILSMFNSHFAYFVNV